MAWKNDMLNKMIDYCQGKVDLHRDYRALQMSDIDIRYREQKVRFGTRQDREIAPLKFALLPKDTVRIIVVDKAEKDYAQKLRMKYRVEREKVRRAIAKEQKKNPEFTGEELLATLEALSATHAQMVATERARLDAEFDRAWEAQNHDLAADQAAFDAMRAKHKEAYAAYVAALDVRTQAKRERIVARGDKLIAFWQKQIDKLKALKAKEIAKAQEAGKSQKIEPLPEDVILRAEGLSMHFGGLKAVDELDFEVKRGEVFGLIGPNGAGKTTVFNCITQFYKPTKGELLFVAKDGQTIRLTDHKVHNIILKGIARTFQNVEVVKEVSVLDNLLIAATRQYHSSFFTQLLHLPQLKKEERLLRAKADRILQYMNLTLYRDRLAWGLPYGVLKRIEIARVLMCNPQLIILDEPAAGLNETETAELAELIGEIRRDFDCTVLLVEHDMGLVMNVCDHICAISFGRKLAYGTPAEVQASREVQEAYLGTGGND